MGHCTDINYPTSNKKKALTSESLIPFGDRAAPSPCKDKLFTFNKANK
jgi:hypothetical protein